MWLRGTTPTWTPLVMNWGCGSAEEGLPRIHEALALTASTEKVIGKRGLQGYTNHRQTRLLDQDG